MKISINTDLTPSSNACWMAWINGRYLGLKTPSAGIVIWEGISMQNGDNSILLAYNAAFNPVLIVGHEFHCELLNSSPSTDYSGWVHNDREAMTRQLAVYYDPTYQSKWVSRTNEPSETNIRVDTIGDVSYTKKTKQVLDLGLNIGKTNFSDGEWIIDRSLNGYDASTTTDDLTTFLSSGEAVFDGTNDYLTIEPQQGLFSEDFTNGFTFSTWVYYDSFNDGSTILDFSDGTSTTEMVIGNYGTVNTLYYNIASDGTTNTAMISDFWDEDQWTYFAMTVDANENVVIYKNGTIYDDTGIGGVPKSVPRDTLYIAKNKWPSDLFQGKIRSLETWNYALSIDEIQKDMRNEMRVTTEDNVRASAYGIMSGLMSLGLPAMMVNANRLEHYINTENNMYITDGGSYKVEQGWTNKPYYDEQVADIVIPYIGLYPAYTFEETDSYTPRWDYPDYEEGGYDDPTPARMHSDFSPLWYSPYEWMRTEGNPTDWTPGGWEYWIDEIETIKDNQQQPVTDMATVKRMRYELDFSKDTVMHPFGQVIMSSDVFPSNIWNENAQYGSELERFLEQGGKIVCPSGYPAFGVFAASGEHPDRVNDDTTEIDIYTGYDEIGDSDLAHQYDDHMYLERMTLEGQTNTVDFLRLYTKNNGSDWINLSAVIYDEAGILQGSKQITLQDPSWAWRIFDFSPDIVLDGTKDYWIGIYVNEMEDQWNDFLDLKYTLQPPTCGRQHDIVGPTTPSTIDLENFSGLSYKLSMYISSQTTSNFDDNYLGNVYSTELTESFAYDGALGHQYIFDIDGANNEVSGRSSFDYGLIAYDPVGDFAEDDNTEYRIDSRMIDTDGDQIPDTDIYYSVIDNENYYYPSDTTGNKIIATTLRNIDYEPYNEQGIFSHMPWTGLDAHLILAKHEYDVFSSDQHNVRRIASIDGFSTTSDDVRYAKKDGVGYMLPSSIDVSHKTADTNDNYWYTNPSYQNELGTSPYVQGLWFKPTLLAGNSVIEPFNPDDDQWYVYYDDTGVGVDEWFTHNERWNVGVGTVQAGGDGKGLVSLMPMFDWDGTGSDSLSGTSYGSWSGYDIRGLLNDRGTGGLANSGSTRDIIRESLVFGNGAMMAWTALENISTNIVRTNGTSNTNVTNPSFDTDNNPAFKYPYDQIFDPNQLAGDYALSIRVNDVAGPDGDTGSDTDNYASYPLFTGSYAKWMWSTNSATDSDPSQYDVYDEVTGVEFDSQVFGVGTFVGTNDALVTSVGFDYGDTFDGSLHNRPQYVSMENITHAGINPEITVRMQTAKELGYKTENYGVNISNLSSQTKARVGITSDSEYGSNDADVENMSWVIYPEDQYYFPGSQFSTTVAANQFNELDNGWSQEWSRPGSGLGKLDLYSNANFSNEFITRSPLVNLYNNQSGYERGLSPRTNYPTHWTTPVPRGISTEMMYGNGSTHPDVTNDPWYNYGGSMGWAYSSPIVIRDDYPAIYSARSQWGDLGTGSISSTFPVTSPTISMVDIQGNPVTPLWLDSNDIVTWPFPQVVTYDPSKVADGWTFGGQYGGVNGEDNANYVANQWLSPNESTILKLEMLDMDPAEMNTKVVRISPALNEVYKPELGDFSYLYVDPIKTVQYRVYDSSDTLVDARTLDFQDWQTTDHVIFYNDPLEIKTITLQITEVWNHENLGYDDTAFDWDMNNGFDQASTAGNNFGGFSEIYWYLDYGTTVPCVIEVIPFGYNEDSMRYPDPESNTFADSGSYYEADNTQGYSMNMLSMNLSLNYKEDDDNGRMSCGYNMQVDGSSAILTKAMARSMKDEIARQKQIGAIVSAITFILVTLTAFLTSGMSAAAIAVAWQLGFRVLAMVDPEKAMQVGCLFDTGDSFKIAIMQTIVQLLDEAQYTLTGERGNWIEVMGPVIFAIYTITDPRGTAPRLVSSAIGQVFFGEDVRAMVFDEYELAMMNGNYYDWEKYPY